MLKMRDIKFRAWEKALKEMIPVHNIDFQKRMINTDSAWRTFDEVELMQFTGLYDKNGKEIYEGDILNLKTSKHNGSFFDLEIETIYKQSVIEWWQSHSNIGYRLRDAKGKTMMVKPSSLNTMEAEVIGNIYENPELITA